MSTSEFLRNMENRTCDAKNQNVSISVRVRVWKSLAKLTIEAKTTKFETNRKELQFVHKTLVLSFYAFVCTVLLLLAIPLTCAVCCIASIASTVKNQTPTRVCAICTRVGVSVVFR